MAGVYATNALPLKAQLIAHELPADFLEDLPADIAAFQKAKLGSGLRFAILNQQPIHFRKGSPKNRKSQA
jgi:hypothetical protein